MKRTKSYTYSLCFVLILGVVCFVACEGTPERKAASAFVVPDLSPLDRFPQPTDPDAYRAYRQDKKKQRRRYIEEMHRCAPDVDWRQIDQETRKEKAVKRFSPMKLLQTDWETSVADGLVKGFRSEKGSRNLL